MGRGLFPRLNVSLRRRRRRRPSAPPVEPGRPGGLGARSDGASPLVAGKVLRKRTTGRDGWRWRRRGRAGLFCGSPLAGEAAVAAQPAGARQLGFSWQGGVSDSGLLRTRSACSCVVPSRSVPCLRRRATDACRRGRLPSGRSPLSPPVCRVVGCSTTREGWSQYNNRTRCVGAARTGHGGGGGWERVSFWGCVGTVRLASQLSRNASQTLQLPPASSRDHAAGLSDGAALLPGAFEGRKRALNTFFIGKPCRPATPRRFTRGRTTLNARRCRGRWRARDRSKITLLHVVRFRVRRRLSADATRRRSEMLQAARADGVQRRQPRVPPEAGGVQHAGSNLRFSLKKHH